MQVAYKYGTYTQGTRQQSTDRPYLLFDKLLLNTFMTSQRLTVRNVTLPPEGTTYRTDLLNRHSVKAPRLHIAPRKWCAAIAHEWSCWLCILFSLCEEPTRERGKFVDQKHDKPCLSVRWLTEEERHVTLLGISSIGTSSGKGLT